jgi:acyl-CoA thioesterase FadM
LTKFDPERQVIYFMAIEKAKFRKPVTPGDQLMLEVTPIRKGGMIWKLRGEARVGDAVVAEAEFMASIQPKPGAKPAAPPVSAPVSGAPSSASSAAGATPGASSPEKAEG